MVRSQVGPPVKAAVTQERKRHGHVLPLLLRRRTAVGSSPEAPSHRDGRFERNSEDLLDGRHVVHVDLPSHLIAQVLVDVPLVRLRKNDVDESRSAGSSTFCLIPPTGNT